MKNTLLYAAHMVGLRYWEVYEKAEIHFFKNLFRLPRNPPDCAVRLELSLFCVSQTPFCTYTSNLLVICIYFSHFFNSSSPLPPSFVFLKAIKIHSYKKLHNQLNIKVLLSFNFLRILPSLIFPLYIVLWNAMWKVNLRKYDFSKSSQKCFRDA